MAWTVPLFHKRETMHPAIADKRILILPIILIAVISFSAMQSTKPIIIKLATLVPAQSQWHHLLMEISEEWEEVSNGRAQLKIYPDGVVGDESIVITKMLINQIQAAAMSSGGLGEIDRGI